MKKILFSILILTGLMAMTSVTANAQNTMTATKNLHTNADTSTHTLKVVGGMDIVTIQVFGVKTSGTPAGTVVLRGSLDGTNYVNLDTLNGLNYQVGSYTITNTTGTQTNAWTLDKSRYVWYQLRIITSGTQVSSWSAKLLNRE